MLEKNISGTTPKIIDKEKDNSTENNFEKSNKFFDYLDGQLLAIKDLVGQFLENGLKEENKIAKIDYLIQICGVFSSLSRAFYNNESIIRKTDIDSVTYLFTLHNLINKIEGIPNLLGLVKEDMEGGDYNVVNLAIIKNGIVGMETISKNLRILEDSELIIEKVNTRDLLNDSLGELEGSINNKEIKINLNIDNNINVKADFIKLKSIIYDVVNNAIKFTNSGGNIDINVRSNDDIVEIVIKDDGIGFSKELQGKLLKEYVNPGAGTNGEMGSGTGLQLSYIIMNRMNGNMKIESGGEDKGTTVIITLPRAE